MPKKMKVRVVYFVYILYSYKYDKFYIGQTNSLRHRLAKHNSGFVKSTKLFIPYVIVWSVEKGTRNEAMALEKKLKNLKSKPRLKKFIEKYS